MDVNGTKFHLLFGRDDWGRCIPAGADATLAALWASPDEADSPPLEWNAAEGNLRLTRRMPLFRPSVYDTPPLSLDLRRGAGRDRYGHWYWIDADRSGIEFLPNGEHQPVPFWSSADYREECAVSLTDSFTACPPLPPQVMVLQGLAVTTRHYLVVGSLTEHGLRVFDLHRSGPPLLLQWPEDVPFEPWDIAPTPDGGLLILDSVNRQYWVLDSQFRLQASVTVQPNLFHEQGQPPDTHETHQPLGYSLDVDGDGPARAVSIESGPQGHVLILDTPASDDPSAVYEYSEAEDGTRTLVRYDLSVEAALVEGESSELFKVRGHDFAYLECAGADCLPIQAAEQTSDPLHLLFVAEQSGNQVVAYRMVDNPPDLVPQPDFLPLRRWQGKGLVTAGGRVYYDFADRWVPLQVLIECHYETRGVFTTPIDFLPDLPGEPFDSAITGCVWHRLLLDADIPPGTRVSIRARAADEADLLPFAVWRDQPIPYRRSGGPELPYFDPYAGLPEQANRGQTWEFLFQQVVGRYLQLEVTLEGTGRSTPELRALRVWFPRFSYLDHYLPAIYAENPASADFTDRWLANFEGLYTNLEDHIQQLPLLLDPDTAPAEALDWLGCWLALSLDPLWDEERRRFLIRHADQLYRQRGTLPGLEVAIRIYLDCKVDDSLFDPQKRGEGRVRIVEDYLLRAETADPSEGAHQFEVLVPHDLDEEDQLMVGRIVDLEKPAHTAYTLKQYWDLFRVGEARLGLDTQIGHSSYLSPFVLGDSKLADGYLAAGYPFDIADRVVSDRDPLGGWPPL